MKKNKTVREKFRQLRKQAEELPKTKKITSPARDAEDPLELIQELQTSQIELELQNEELHRSQQALIKSQLEYAKLYDLAPVGYVSLSLKGVILNANLTLADYLSMDRGALINTLLSAHVVFEDQDIYYHHLRGVLDSRTRQTCELRLEKKNGTPFDVRLESTITSDEGKKADQCRTVIIDISRQRTAEKQREQLESQLYLSKKMETIGNLAGGIAHDFNNILFIIIGNAELSLEDIPGDSPLHANIEEIKAAALRGSDIVKLLMNYRRKTDQELKPVKISSMMKDALKFLRSTLPASIDIRETFRVTDETILADPVQINQAMMNLCINASQEMEQSGGVLEICIDTIRLEKRADHGEAALAPGTYVKIEVSDTGPGIAPGIIDQIFDPYFTTKAFGKGSGMGLAVVHGIVKNHNGRIRVTSLPGKGTSFTILFPTIDQNPGNEVKKLKSISQGKKSILFVDDETAITAMAKKGLERLHYRVETKSDPEEALALFKLNPDHFDVVITDMTMPKINGVKLAEKLMKIRSNIPVIIATGNYALINEEKARQIGIAGYAMKPVSMSKVATLIQEILDKQALGV